VICSPSRKSRDFGFPGRFGGALRLSVLAIYNQGARTGRASRDRSDRNFLFAEFGSRHTITARELPCRTTSFSRIVVRVIQTPYR
jgi:hypothetical protein